MFRFPRLHYSYLLFYTNMGRVYKLKAYDIPEAGRTAKGTAIVNLLQLSGEERVSAVIVVGGDSKTKDLDYLIMATRRGTVKKTPISEFSNIRTNGLIAISLADGDELIDVRATNGKDDVLVATQNGQMIRFNEEDVRSTGRASMGVKAISLTEGDQVIGMQLASDGSELLAVSEEGLGKRMDLSEFNTQHRGGKGVLYYKLTKRTGRVVSFLMVDPQQDLMIINTAGVIIRIHVSEIRKTGRIASGVKLISLEEGVKIVSVAAVPELKEEAAEEEKSKDQSPKE